MSMTLENGINLLLISLIKFLCLNLIIYVFWKRPVMKTIFIFFLISKNNSSPFIFRILIIIYKSYRWLIIYITSILLMICINYRISMHVIYLGDKNTFVVEIFKCVAIIKVQINWISCFLYVYFGITKSSVLYRNLKILYFILDFKISLVMHFRERCCSGSPHAWINCCQFFQLI